MRILIQKMKTIRTVTENNSPNQETQTKSKNENPNALSFEMASIARPSQTSPYGEAIKEPPPNEQRYGTKLEKIDQDQPQGQELPQQKTGLRPWKQWKWKMRPHI